MPQLDLYMMNNLLYSVMFLLMFTYMLNMNNFLINMNLLFRLRKLKISVIKKFMVLVLYEFFSKFVMLKFHFIIFNFHKNSVEWIMNFIKKEDTLDMKSLKKFSNWTRMF